MKKLAPVLFLILMLLTSCGGSQENDNPFLIPESDGSYWIQEITVDDPDEELSFSDFDPSLMYGSASYTDETGFRSSDSNAYVEQNLNGTYSLRPDENGSVHFKPSDIGARKGDKLLVYQLKENKYTKDKDLYFDYTEEPLYYAWDSENKTYMKVFEEFYHLDLSKPKHYGITDISRVVIFDIRLSTQGGGTTSVNFDFRGAPPAGINLQSMQALHDASMLGEINYYLLARIFPDSNGGWRTCLRTPVTLETGGESIELTSPEAYEIKENSNDLIAEVTIPENSNLLFYGYIEMYSNKDGSSFNAPLIGKDGNEYLFYIPALSDDYHFPVYWWNPRKNNEVYYRKDGSIRIREIKESDRQFFNEYSASDAQYSNGRYRFSLNSNNLRRRSDNSILIVFNDLSFDNDLSIRVKADGNGMFRYSYSDAHGKGSSAEDMNQDVRIEGNGIKLDWLLLDPGVSGNIEIILE